MVAAVSGDLARLRRLGGALARASNAAIALNIAGHIDIARRELLAAPKTKRPIPERATVVDPEPKPAEPVSEALKRPDAPARRPRQSAAADPRPVGPVCRETRAEPDAPAERVEAPHPAPADWRAARKALRQAGHLVEQYDGRVRIDGRISRDPALYPPELVPA